MSKLTRRPRGSIVARFCITLWEGQDDDLIKLFEGVKEGEMSKTLKDAIRNGIARKDEGVFTEDDDIDLSGLGIDV